MLSVYTIAGHLAAINIFDSDVSKCKNKSLLKFDDIENFSTLYDWGDGRDVNDDESFLRHSIVKCCDFINLLSSL